MKTRQLLLISVLFLSALWSQATVKYNEGQVMVKGVLFLQEYENPNNYYYLPQYPRLSRNEKGLYELLCMKYVGQGGAETNGGIFHALIEFSMPPEFVETLQKELQEKTANKNATIAGPVPLQQTLKEGENTPGGFQIISSILTNTTGKDAFTRNIIASGHAPLLPGSKAAVSARLSQEGATLLFESLKQPTSDVSVSLNGYYEATTKAYNATVTAESSVIYEHYSRLSNIQSGYTRDQLRKITDDLRRDQSLKIDIFDGGGGSGVDTKNLQGILDAVTDKLIELMFDTQNGWSKEPPREAAVEVNQILGRQERGFFSEVFGGAQDTPYFSDNQFVLKKRTDIRTNKFYLNLSKTAVIRVPFYTSGNLSGIYKNFGADTTYFRTVNLDDADFQRRDVHFQVDGDFAESFKDIFNFVTVSFRKTYGGSQNDATADLIFKRGDLEKGNDIQLIKYPRLGTSTSDWLNYEYRISWSLKGNNLSIKEPSGENQWKSSKASAISLIPPFSRRLVEVDADRTAFKDAKILTATVRFLAIVGGKPQIQKTITLRAGDPTSTSKVTLFHDVNQPVAYQITWYDNKGKASDSELKEITDNYLLLIPPVTE
jgi:hypothetical protein